MLYSNATLWCDSVNTFSMFSHEGFINCSPMKSHSTPGDQTEPTGI